MRCNTRSMDHTLYKAFHSLQRRKGGTTYYYFNNSKEIKDFYKTIKN